VIFILASPESGAELVKHALGTVPGVTALPVATNLFSSGFDLMLDTWRASLYCDRVDGFIDLVDEQEFLWNVRRLADGLFAPAAPGGMSEQLIVEYSSAHIRFVRAIVTLYPDAHLLHVVRDGGEVAARLASPHRDLYAGGQDGPAPEDQLWRLPRIAAQQWVDDQNAIEEFADESNYFVARIERILADPAAFFGWLAERVGLEADTDAIEAAADAIGAGRWRLTTPPAGRPQALVNTLGGELLDRYDYEPTDVGEGRALLGRVELGYERFTDRGRQALLNLAARLSGLSARWEADAKGPG